MKFVSFFFKTVIDETGIPSDQRRIEIYFYFTESPLPWNSDSFLVYIISQPTLFQQFRQ